MTNKERIYDLLNALFLNDRRNLIRAINEHSVQKYENTNSVWEIAKMNKPELRQIIRHLINYYQC